MEIKMKKVVIAVTEDHITRSGGERGGDENPITFALADHGYRTIMFGRNTMTISETDTYLYCVVALEDEIERWLRHWHFGEHHYELDEQPPAFEFILEIPDLDIGEEAPLEDDSYRAFVRNKAGSPMRWYSRL